ncbi:MAG: apolipoprotein N-acyltransferase [Deltaproteobacteria bacterium]|nr:apolipoprotein N-acyltransferase [Deltaproteobacteria bacterium]
MRRLVLAILAGLCYTLSLPAYELWPLAWFFAVPIFFLAREVESPAEIFIYGIIAGIVAWAGTLYWIAYVMENYGGMSLVPAAFLLLLLISFLSLYFAVFAWGSQKLIRSRFAFLTIPGLWVLLELVRSYVPFSGFPWALAGYTQFPWKPFIQIAEFGGVYLISGIILMVNVAVYKALNRSCLPLVLSAAVLLAASVWGNYRMDTLTLEGEKLRVGIAQANIAQEEKWLPSMVEPTIDIYSRLTGEAVNAGAELVVWPETACNFFLFRKWPASQRIIDLSLTHDARLVVGSPAYDDGRYFNRVWLLKDGVVEDFYDKVHLVPFGEYLPLAGLIQPFFGSLTQGVGDFSRAREASPLDGIGVLICFESIFPGMTRTLCGKGATFLVNASNDAWFKTWSTPRQHLIMAAFRTVESRRWMLRSVNHGISAMVNPFGEVVSKIGLLEEGVITGEITRTSFQSFYVRYGPVLAWIWACASFIAALTTIRRRC